MFFNLSSTSPLITTMIDGYKYNNSDSIWEIQQNIKYGDKTKLNFDGFKYRYNAKWFDLLGCVQLNSYFSFLLSDNFYQSIKSYNLIKHSTAEAVVYKNKDHFRSYKVFLFDKSITEYINFEKSEFYYFVDHLTQQKCDASVKTLKNFFDGKSRFDKGNQIRMRKLVLNKNFDLDIFTVWNISGGIIVSQRLKEHLEKSGLTGLSFEETNIIK